MIKGKYIVFEDDTPVVFDARIEHAMMANMVKSQYPGWEPTSAGFLSVDVMMLDEDGACQPSVHVSGNSHSLNLKPGEHDVRLLNRLILDDYWRR